MTDFRAYASLVFFFGLGGYVALGGALPYDPECSGKCYTNGIVDMVEAVGAWPVSLGLYGVGLLSFFWWKHLT